MDRTLSIEGTIAEVMESWPLQLMVETSFGLYYIELLEDTKVIQNGEDVAMSRLMPNRQVVVRGQASSIQENALIAYSIEIK